MKNDFLKLCDELLSNQKKFDDSKFFGLKKMLAYTFTDDNHKLVVPIGISEDNEYVYMDLTDVPGIFISGTTGTGKSVFLDTVIVSLMLKNTKEEVNFLMIDPKKVELGEYDGISYINLNNHYQKYSISSKEKGYKALNYVFKIMEERSNILTKNHCKNIQSYNAKNKQKLPHIFIFIDEASDIIEMKDAENVLSKILNVGRALGIHLILATNAYLRKMFTNRFISRFKYRMSFDLTDKLQALYVEIHDADVLLAPGDTLIRCPGKTYHLQTPYIKDDEIERVSDVVGERKGD